jgi:hypothetical protein
MGYFDAVKKGDIGGGFFRSDGNNGRKMMDRRWLQRVPRWGGEAE